MDERLKQVLEDNDIDIGIKGSRDHRVSSKLTRDLYKASEDDKAGVLTEHGARLVFEAKRGSSYKEIGEALFARAEQMVVEANRRIEAAETRHRLEVDAFMKTIKELRDAQPPIALASPAEEPVGTAGN